MTGRDLIIYILANDLENELIFEDGNFIGFVTVGEAASEMNVGAATILTWANQGRLQCVVVGDMIYVPADFKTKLQDTLR